MPEPMTMPNASTGILQDYLSKEQLAAVIGRSTRTLDRWELLRIGPPRTAIGRLILYRADGVHAWLRGREGKHGQR